MAMSRCQCCNLGNRRSTIFVPRLATRVVDVCSKGGRSVLSLHQGPEAIASSGLKRNDLQRAIGGLYCVLIKRCLPNILFGSTRKDRNNKMTPVKDFTISTFSFRTKRTVKSGIENIFLFKTVIKTQNSRVKYRHHYHITITTVKTTSSYTSLKV